MKPHLADGEVCPQSWEELPLTRRMQIEAVDPEVAQVFTGQMPAALEQEVMAGRWGSTEAVMRDPAAEREAAIQAALAQLQPKSHEQLEAARRERLAEQQQAARNSYVAAHGRWGA